MSHVIITRPSGLADQNDQFLERLKSLGWTAHWLKVLECVPVVTEETKRLAQGLIAGEYSWLIFQSKTGVRALKALLPSGILPSGLKVAAQGSGSADEFKKLFGNEVDFIPREFVAESLLSELSRELSTTDKIFLPVAAIGRDIVYDGLKGQGFQIERAALYETRPTILEKADLGWLERLNPKELHWIFMSPSAVLATDMLVKTAKIDMTPKAGHIISIGPVTSKALHKVGWDIFSEANPHSEQGVLNALGR